VGVDAGSVQELEAAGRVLTKVGDRPVVVFWHEGRAWAVEDRCPHLGFPLHRGSVEAGLLTCHWHHARFDLASGCALDLFADDATGFDVAVADGRVLVSARPQPDPVAALEGRLRDGLEEGLDLVLAKSVLGLLETGVAPARIVAGGLEFGAAHRQAGWSPGMTILVAMANLLPDLHGDDVPMALVHGLSAIADDTRGQPPRFPLRPLAGAAADPERLAAWYRRFVDTRSTDAAERALVTALAGGRLGEAEAFLFAAVTDHVFVDEGHTIDFANKAMEGLEHIGADGASWLLPTLVPQMTGAARSEESSPWRHPDDLVGLLDGAVGRLPETLAAGADRPTPYRDDDVERLAWGLLGDDPAAVVAAVEDALRAGATGEQMGRAVAYAAALRLTRFHVQNDFADWDTVHHAFTTANALHQALRRRPTPELLRGVFHSALRTYLDRFLNVPAARLPTAGEGDLAELEACWDVQGEVDRAGGLVAGHLRAGGRRSDAVAALGRALLHEDAGFHWYQVVEAGARQAASWPAGSEPPALILAGVARFLAAHTPTRRQLPTVIALARRLRRGEHLYEELAAPAG
jgi:nitrite reductase/ring-hydroxylating ferredoxin subunit